MSRSVEIEGAFPDVCIGRGPDIGDGVTPVPLVYTGKRSSLGLLIETVEVEDARQ